MSKSTSSTMTRLIRAGVATAFVSAAVLITTANPAAAIPITLSAASGPSGSSTTTITGSATTNFLTGYTAPVAYFTQANCPAAWTSAATGTVAPSASNTGVTKATVVKKLANNKVAVTVPAAIVTVGTNATQKYNLCIYGQGVTNQALAGNAAYSVAAAAAVTGISPSAGPPTGGNVVTVVGTGFPATGITATLGGAAMTSIGNITSTSFTALAPAHSAEADVTLAITTTSGISTLKDAYDYVNGINIAPNTAPSTTTSIDIDVIGSGFLDASFTGNARVYLVNGVYNGITAGGLKMNGPVADCTNVLVVDDTELICTLNLAYRLNTAGTYATQALRTVTDGVFVNASKTFTSATAAFTVNDIGVPIANANIPVGTTIVSLNSATSAVLSNAATAAATTQTVTINGPVRAPFALTAATLDSTAVTAASSSFVAADVGRPITGTGIPAGTIITAIVSGGGGATLSQAVTATGTPTVSIFTARPVPDDAYVLTVISNSTADALPADVDYVQTIISSGSTFTVAPY
jgi:hypothetical protein